MTSIRLHGVIDFIIEPGYSISYTVACACSEALDQSEYPRSLIRVFAKQYVAAQRSKASSSGQQRLRSDCADAQADVSLRWTHMLSFGNCCVSAELQIWSRYIRFQTLVFLR